MRDQPKALPSGRRTPPESIQDLRIWAVWSPEFGKTPMAPWETGHMYPAPWGSDVEDRPEHTYEKAKMVVDLGPDLIHENYSFPPKDGDDDPHIPDRLYPTILLPHDPPDPPIMQVDFDDVRDPETGEIAPEVWEIVQRLDSYTEISQSGEGLHVFVRAELPGALGKFIASIADREHVGEFSELSIASDGDGGNVVDVRAALPDHVEHADDLFEHEPGEPVAGDIELYDHGRFVGCTWDHVEGTPTEIRECQDVIDEIVQEYETPSIRNRRENSNERAGEGGSPTSKKAQAELDAIRDDFDTGGQRSRSRRRSVYYALDIRPVADTGYFSSYRKEAPGDDWTGPHPAHGAQHSDLDECTNFGVDVSGNQWNCFAHEGGGGGALSLLAVVEGVVDCDNAKAIHKDPAKLLKTCLYARDKASASIGESLDEAGPPYKALVAVAQQFDLPMKDPEKGILGETGHEIARRFFDEMEPDDVEGV